MKTLRFFSVLVLGTGLMLWAGCDSTDTLDDDPNGDDEGPRQISYTLDAQPNEGAVPDGADGEVTFWEIDDQTTLVTLELDGGNTGAEVAHPAHIHNNSATQGGGIEIYLSPIDGSGGDGTSARLVNRSYEDLVDFDGYVNVHESVANLDTVIAQGNIGANADGTEGTGLELVEDRRSTDYTLEAYQNEGTVAPEGVEATATFTELTEDETLVTIQLDSTFQSNVGHPTHIHNDSASVGGSIAFHLSPIDGTDEDARSSKLVGDRYETLTDFDGHADVHESVENQQDTLSVGNIGANADGN